MYVFLQFIDLQRSIKCETKEKVDKCKKKQRLHVFRARNRIRIRIRKYLSAREGQTDCAVACLPAWATPALAGPLGTANICLLTEY